MSETGDPYFDSMGALADHNLDELIKAREALAASAARIEALTEALREIEAHLADHWNCGAVQLFLIASRALVTARAALTPEDRR